MNRVNKKRMAVKVDFSRKMYLLIFYKIYEESNVPQKAGQKICMLQQKLDHQYFSEPNSSIHVRLKSTLIR